MNAMLLYRPTFTIFEILRDCIIIYCMSTLFLCIESTNPMIFHAKPKQTISDKQCFQFQAYYFSPGVSLVGRKVGLV